MSEAPEHPQIYLVTPPVIELSRFPAVLASVLDDVEVVCVRMALAGSDEDQTARVADALRDTCHSRDVAIVIDTHVMLSQRLGLDGVHLLDGRDVRSARKTLGADAIVGAFAGTSRHDGMLAGESGADYVAFGPVGETSLGQGSRAPEDLFAWWSAMIELPVVAEGALDADSIAALSPVTDFFAIGQEIWGQEDPRAALRSLETAMRG